MIGAIDPNIYKSIHSSKNSIYLKNLHYSALGYSYFSLGEFKDAIKAYRSIESDSSESEHLAHCYNKRLCEGILAYKDGKLEESIKLFETSTDFLMRA